jgi:excisionase family DNA binding protein
MKKTKNKAFYSAQELADALELNIMTIYRHIKAKRLVAYKIGKEYRVAKKDFDTFLKRSRTR